MKVSLTPHLKKTPNFIKSFLAGFHWKLCFRLWYNFLRKGTDTVVLPITALSARLPEKLFFRLMARFKPGTFSLHFFFLFLSHIFLFFLWNLPLLLALSQCLSSGCISSLAAFLILSVSPVAPSLLGCCRREDPSSQKQSESDSQHTAHTAKGCLWVSATRHGEQAAAKSSQSGRALTLQAAWLHSICLSRSGAFLTNYTGKALLKSSMLLSNHQCSCQNEGE